MRLSDTEGRAVLRAALDAAITAALPDRIAQLLPDPPKGRTVVVGAGKAAASMAAAFEQAWPHPLSGIVVTRYGHAVATRTITVLEASHPVPDEAGERAARQILAAVSGLTGDDLVVALISGGGSALLAAPPAGMGVDDLKTLNRALLASGADIAAMNTLRKHMSAIAGGRLAAAAWPARVVTIAISDVPGDEPGIIASGPTVPDPSTRADAKAIALRYCPELPRHMRDWLDNPASESPKPDHPAFSTNDYRFLARPIDSLRAAEAAVRAKGLPCLILGDSIEGEARDVARVHLGIARSVLDHGLPAPAPLVILSGGETTVTLRGKGRGGRNSEFTLALLAGLADWPPHLSRRIMALAADTDGIDGVESNAGAMITPETLARAEALGLSPRTYLDNNDAFGFFSALSDLLVITGPTQTNVNDLRAILILPD